MKQVSSKHDMKNESSKEHILIEKDTIRVMKSLRIFPMQDKLQGLTSREDIGYMQLILSWTKDASCPTLKHSL